MPARLLVVDDDPHLRDVVSYALAREGHQITLCANGREALDALNLDEAARRFDLVVLDVTMPELDGLELCRRIRASAQRALPIVFLSSRDEEIDKVLGLELGGDDYLTKPFSVRELCARVKAVLRRAEQREAPPATREAKRLKHGRLCVDLDRHTIDVDDVNIALTVTEFGLLVSLLERPGFVLTRSQLMEQAYAYDNLITERTIDTHVKRVRKKFRHTGLDPIETVHGVGYKLRV
ncbi:MAG: response regulator transcription factor [Myxococcales bacterium]|nr:response regulator transcription factor [Myxococcales bacterium]